MPSKNEGKKVYRPGKKPLQIYLDETTKLEFETLIKTYDPLLSNAGAVVKLILWAIETYSLPGYAKKENLQTLNNEMASNTPVLMPKKAKKSIDTLANS